MWNGYCGELIRRINRRLLLVVLAICAGLVIFFTANHAYFNGFFTGPHKATDAEILAAQGAGGFRNVFVSLQGGATTNTKLAEYTRDDAHPDGYVSARYLTTEIGGKELLVRVDPNTPMALDSDGPAQVVASSSFTGCVHAFSEKTAAIVNTANQAGGYYLPYYLDTYDYKSFGWVSVVIGGLLLIAAVWGAWLYVIRNGNPAEHPFAKGLARYGALESIVPQLDAEMLAAHTTYQYRANAAHVTLNWYLVTIPFGAKASPLPSLVWVFRKIVKRRIYFVIPAGTQQSLVALDRFGKRSVVQLRPSQIDELLPLLKNVARQAIYGYDKRVNKLWQAGRKMPDRIAFITEAQTMLAGHALPESMTTSRYNA